MSILDALTDRWNYEIVYEEEGVEKHYRCMAGDALDAFNSFNASTEDIPDVFVVIKREDL